MPSLPSTQHPEMTDLFVNPYAGYSYAYPHKLAYRDFALPVPLNDLWAEESKTNLFLYLHIPFCHYRCGFCNLFTAAQPQETMVEHYLDACQRQFQVVQREIQPESISQFAVGGGTPSILSNAQLRDCMHAIQEVFRFSIPQIAASIEVSPDTIDRDKCLLIKELGFSRVSIGVQSFDPTDASACGRPQNQKQVLDSLSILASTGFPTFNIDLIYGMNSQTEASWLASLNQALEYSPNELFLYPLYVRELTGLGKTGKHASDTRLRLYEMGRDFLLEQGFTQQSMRQFVKKYNTQTNDRSYCCQVDGMIGLGCGARSYTTKMHYSHDFAVSQGKTKEIIRQFVLSADSDFAQVGHGFRLNADEQHRRYVIQSILNTTGLDVTAYQRRFSSDCCDDLPELFPLLRAGYLEYHQNVIKPTARGLQWSDAIGPSLYSPSVQRLMEESTIQ
ncbi:MAG: STM4012 family radical SAM protein [Zavarzinella sp.]